MEILDIIPKDVYVVMEITVKEMESIKAALDIAEFQGEGVENFPHVRFVVDKFYPFLTKALEKINGS